MTKKIIKPPQKMKEEKNIKKCQKIQNPKKSNFFQNITFFSKSLKILTIYFFHRLPHNEISLRPEISSPSRFRIQGGYCERDKWTKDKGRKSLCLI